MAKFSNAKVGDKVWSIAYGWGEITGVGDYLFRVKFSDCCDCKLYNFDGKRVVSGEIYPTLFWKEFNIPVKDDKKPFNLVNFLKENLTYKEFVKDEKNYILYFDANRGKWDWIDLGNDYVFTAYFNDCTYKIVNKLSEQKISPKQLKEAYKELGWL